MVHLEYMETVFEKAVAAEKSDPLVAIKLFSSIGKLKTKVKCFFCCLVGNNSQFQNADSQPIRNVCKCRSSYFFFEYLVYFCDFCCFKFYFISKR